MARTDLWRLSATRVEIDHRSREAGEDRGFTLPIAFVVLDSRVQHGAGTGCEAVCNQFHLRPGLYSSRQ